MVLVFVVVLLLILFFAPRSSRREIDPRYYVPSYTYQFGDEPGSSGVSSRWFC
jgi:hypothetical protein